MISVLRGVVNGKHTRGCSCESTGLQSANHGEDFLQIILDRDGRVLEDAVRHPGLRELLGLFRFGGGTPLGSGFHDSGFEPAIHWVRLAPKMKVENAAEASE